MKNKQILVLIFLLSISIPLQASGAINWRGGNWHRVYDPSHAEYIADLSLASGNYIFEVEFSGDLTSTNAEVKLGTSYLFYNSYSHSNHLYYVDGVNNYIVLKYSFGNPHGLNLPCNFGNFRMKIWDANGKFVDEKILTLDGFDRFEFSINNNRVTEPNTHNQRTSKGGVFREYYAAIDHEEYSGSEHVTAYKGCGLDLKVYEMCRQNADMTLEIAEYSTITNTIVPGTKTSRLLDPSELDLLHGTGTSLNFLTYTGDNGITHDFSSPKEYYLLTLTDKRHGQWRPNFKYIQFKDGPADFKMSDNLRDLGFEPNRKDNYDIYHSPYLFNRNVPPGTTGPYLLVDNVHQDPDFVTIAGNENRLHYVYDNIGCNTTSINGELRLFWTRARTDELWDVHWKYDPIDNFVTSALTNNAVPAGSEITILDPTTLDPYNATSKPETIFASGNQNNYTLPNQDEVRWFCPDPRHYDSKNGSMSTSSGVSRPVICFLSVINTPTTLNDPITFAPTTDKIDPFVRNNNNVVTRNSLFYDDPGFLVDHGNGDWDYDFGTVWLNNPTNFPRTQDVCVELINNEYTQDFLDFGRIEIGTTNEIWGSWISNGMNADSSISVIQPTLFELNGSIGCINDITVLPDSYEQIGLRFVYDGNVQLPNSAMHFTYRISPIIPETTGTNTIFDVSVPTQSPLPPTSYNWSSVSKENSITEELSVYPNPTEGQITVTYTVSPNTETIIELRDIHGRLIKQITNNDKELTNFSNIIDLSHLANGLYTVTLKTASSRITKNVQIIN